VLFLILTRSVDHTIDYSPIQVHRQLLLQHASLVEHHEHDGHHQQHGARFSTAGLGLGVGVRVGLGL
jgi:hypothetical protein